MNRRLTILSALLATALLLYSMPGLLTRHLSSTGRTDDRLKPAKARTMVVWVTSWMEEDRKLIASLCTAFEKQQPGLRIYLRRVDAHELSLPDAVLPDVVLHVTGDISAPEDGLIPVAHSAEMPDVKAASGCLQGRQYGIPLWYSPMVFSVPKAWYVPENQQEPGQRSEAGQAYFSQKPIEPEGTTAAISFAELPWNRVLDAGQLISENGVGLCLLTLECPLSLRQEWRRLTPVLRKPEAGEAAVCSMNTHQARGQEAVALSLPYAGQQARYISLCREGEDTTAFLCFLLSGEAQQAAREALLTPMMGDTAEEVFLPNAFLMDQTNVNQHCIQGVAAGEDPVATLLKLR